MTHTMNSYLARVTKSKYDLQLSPDQWISKGATEFKRRAMGYCGTKTTKSVEEIIDILIKMHPNHLTLEAGAELKQELKILTDNLDNQILKYDWGNISFEKINPDNSDSSIKYIIKKC